MSLLIHEKDSRYVTGDENARVDRVLRFGGTGMAQVVLSGFPMYLREVLRACQALEEELGHIYEELAAQHAHDPNLGEHWLTLAADKRRHGRLLAAALAAENVFEDDGPFVVDVREQLDRTAKILDHAYQRVREGISPEAAVELATFIENSELDDVFGEVVELARPALLRVLGTVEEGVAEDDPHHAHLRQLVESFGQKPRKTPPDQ